MANLIYYTSNTVFATNSKLSKPDPTESELIYSKNSAEGEYQNGTFNLNYLGKLDTLGTTLSADLDYAHIQNYDEFEFRNRIVPAKGPVRTPLFLSDNPSGYDIYSAKTDLVKVFSKDLKLELGAKASYVKSDNDLRFFNTADNVKTLDNTRSNHFIYEENILAAYTSLSASLSDKWSIQAGLRAEYTDSEGMSVTKNQQNNRDYLDFFPTLFVQQKLSDNYQIGYKYSRRINRPEYQKLNPFIFYLDPFTSAQGNPDLRPMYVNSFEMTHTLQQTYNLIVGYAITKDFIAEVPSQNPETNTTVFQTMNVDDLKSATATLVAPVRVTNKWEISNNIIGMYQEFTYTTPENEVLKSDQFTLIAQSNHSIALPHGVKLEVGGGYQSPAVYALYQVDDQWWVDAGLKRSFLNDKLAFTLNVTDIFKSRSLNVETNLNGNVQAIEQYHGARGVRVGLRYRFSKGSAIQVWKKNVNLDELNRAGSNN